MNINLQPDSYSTYVSIQVEYLMKYVAFIGNLFYGHSVWKKYIAVVFYSIYWYIRTSLL